MSLFDNCKLPDDDRAQEILSRISELWDDNAACSKKGTPRFYHQRVSLELKEALIDLSLNSPQMLEEMLNREVSFHNILRFAEGHTEVADF